MHLLRVLQCFAVKDHLLRISASPSAFRRCACAPHANALPLPPHRSRLHAPPSRRRSRSRCPPGFKVELLREAGPDDGSWICMAQDEQGRLYISPQGACRRRGFKRTNKWGGIVARDDRHDRKSHRQHPAARHRVGKGARAGRRRHGHALGVRFALRERQGPEGRGIYRLQGQRRRRRPRPVDALERSPRRQRASTARTRSSSGRTENPSTSSTATPRRSSTASTRLAVPQLRRGRPAPARHGPGRHLLRQDQGALRLRPAHRRARHASGSSSPAASAIPTTSTSTPTANSSPTTATWSGTWASRGIAPRACSTSCPAANTASAKAPRNGPRGIPTRCPPRCDIGLGCPTGVKFGTKRSFPEKYRRAFFIMDWTFGRILAVTLHEKGASYTAKNDLASYTYPRDAEASGDVEVFLSGKGMPVTDLEFLRRRRDVLHRRRPRHGGGAVSGELCGERRWDAGRKRSAGSMRSRASYYRALVFGRPELLDRLDRTVVDTTSWPPTSCESNDRFGTSALINSIDGFSNRRKRRDDLR